MADVVAPEFARFINEERRASRLPTSRRQLAEGEISHPIFIENGRVSEFLRVAAKRAVGLFRPTKRTEVVWVQGDSELAVNLVKPGRGDAGQCSGRLGGDPADQRLADQRGRVQLPGDRVDHDRVPVADQVHPKAGAVQVPDAVRVVEMIALSPFRKRGAEQFDQRGR